MGLDPGSSLLEEPLVPRREPSGFISELLLQMFGFVPGTLMPLPLQRAAVLPERSALYSSAKAAGVVPADVVRS